MAVLISMLPEIIQAMQLLDKPEYPATYATNVLRLAYQALQTDPAAINLTNSLPNVVKLLNGLYVFFRTVILVRQHLLRLRNSASVSHVRMVQVPPHAMPEVECTSTGLDTAINIETEYIHNALRVMSVDIDFTLIDMGELIIRVQTSCNPRARCLTLAYLFPDVKLSLMQFQFSR